MSLDFPPAWDVLDLEQVVPAVLDEVRTQRPLREHLRGYIQALRDSSKPCDMALWDGRAPGPGARTTAAYTDAGVAWWLEGLHAARGALEAMRTRIRAGPAAG